MTGINNCVNDEQGKLIAGKELQANLAKIGPTPVRSDYNYSTIKTGSAFVDDILKKL